VKGGLCIKGGHGVLENEKKKPRGWERTEVTFESGFCWKRGSHQKDQSIFGESIYKKIRGETRFWGRGKGKRGNWLGYEKGPYNRKGKMERERENGQDADIGKGKRE